MAKEEENNNLGQNILDRPIVAILLEQTLIEGGMWYDIGSKQVILAKKDLTIELIFPDLPFPKD